MSRWLSDLIGTLADTFSVKYLKFRPSTADGSPVNGEVYYDSTLKRLESYDATAWQQYLSLVDATTFVYTFKVGQIWVGTSSSEYTRIGRISSGHWGLLALDSSTSAYAAEWTQAYWRVNFVLTLGSSSQSTPSSNVNDYVAGTSIERFSPTTDINLTGIVSVITGHVVSIQNQSALHSLTLKHQSTSSSAANRFSLPLGQDIVLGANDAITLVYDSDAARWVVTNYVPLTLTTTGSSGAATLIGTTLNVPVYTQSATSICDATISGGSLM